MRKLALAAAAATLLLLSVSTAAQAVTLPTTPTGTSATCCYQTRPAQIRPGLGGALVFGGIGPHFGNIAWTGWTSKLASGTAVAWQDNYCKQGRCPWRGFRVRLWLWHPVLMNSRWFFTQMKFAYRYNVPDKYTPKVVDLVWSFQGFWRDDANSVPGAGFP